MTRHPNYTWDGRPVEYLQLPRSPIRKSGHRTRPPVASSVTACTACELHDGCRAPVPPMFPDRPVSAFAVVGTAPTPLDDRKGIPFVSRGGQVLRKLMGEVGLDVHTGAWLNAVACATDAPDPDHLDSCRNNLISSLHAANTRFVLLCGAVAVGAWHEGLTVTGAHGQWFIWWEEERRRGWWVMPTFHPAAVLKQPSLRDQLRDDLTKFASVVVDHRTPVPCAVCVRCGEPQARWDPDGVGWCEGCWAEQIKKNNRGVRRGGKRVHKDQASFKF